MSKLLPFSAVNLPFFNLKSKSALFFGIGIALFVAIRCIWLWQPDRQVERHHEALLAALGDRDWKALDALIADDFKHIQGHDQGYDKAWLLKEAGEVRRHFFALTVRGDFPDRMLTPARDGATVEAVIRLEGSGTAVASYVIQKVNEQKEPFTFIWVKQSWKPWDWQLTAVSHPLINQAHRRSGW